MPDIYPPAHRRIQFQGTLDQIAGGGSEIFEFGFADASGLTVQAAATAALAKAHGRWADGGLELSTYARLVGVRAEDVDAEGKVTASYYVGQTPQASLSDGANWTILSLCVTLETNTPDSHGRMVRGRFYPPGYPTGTGATISTAAAQSYANEWAGFMADMVAGGLVPAVASVTGGGQIANVTAVSAATVIDTVRRRKNHVTVSRSTKVPISS